MSEQAEPKSAQPAHGVVRDQTTELPPPLADANIELVESLHQFVTIWKLIGKPFPRVDSADKPGLAISWPNTRFPFYNSLFLIDQLTDARVLQDRVQEAAAYMRARTCGGLAGNILPMEAPGHPALRLVRIWDDSTIQAFAELNCMSYGVPTAHAATGIRRTVLHATEAGYPIYLRVGYRPTVKFMGCRLES